MLESYLASLRLLLLLHSIFDVLEHSICDVLFLIFFKEFAYHGLAQTNGVQSSQNVDESVVENEDNNNVEVQDENDETPGKDIQDKTDGQR